MQQYPQPYQPMGVPPQGGPGSPYPGYPGAGQWPAEPKTNRMALTGLILGICTLTIGWCTAGPLMGVLGIVMSAIGLGQINKSGGAEKGKGMAIAGLVTSGVGLFFILVAIVLLFGLGLYDELNF